MIKYLIGTAFCVPVRIDSESVAKQIPMIDKCVCTTSIIHLGKLALIMLIWFWNVGRYIGITCTSVHVFRFIDLCAAQNATLMTETGAHKMAISTRSPSR